jgi:hypothetical protein
MKREISEIKPNNIDNISITLDIEKDLIKDLLNYSSDSNIIILIIVSNGNFDSDAKDKDNDINIYTRKNIINISPYTNIKIDYTLQDEEKNTFDIFELNNSNYKFNLFN